MSGLIPIATVNFPNEEVMAWLMAHLTAEGYRLERTFDLQAALLPHHECSCPHHGTEKCDCQMVVVLVYRDRNDPATLVLHSQDGRTWLSLAHMAGDADKHAFETGIVETLAPLATDGQAASGSADSYA